MAGSGRRAAGSTPHRWLHGAVAGRWKVRTGIAVGWTFLTRIDTPARSSLTGVSILVISIAKGGRASSVGGGLTAHARRGLNTLRHLPENIYKALCVSGKGIILLPQEHRYGFILQPEEGNGPYSRIFVYQLTGACPKEIGSVYSSRSINCPRSFISMRRLAEAYSSASV